MGMNVGDQQGGLQTSINVTPLIDVLLVLLIIFLVIMPIMVKSESLEVPRTASPDSVMEVAPITLMIKDDLEVVLDDGDKQVPVTAADLPKTLRAKLGASTQKVVFVDFDAGVPWREVVGTMDTVRGLAGDPSHDGITLALKLDSHP